MWTLLTNRHSFFTALNLFVGTFNAAFIYGFIATTLTDVGLADSQVGFVYSAEMFAYLIGCLFMACLCNNVPRKLSYFICFLIFVVALLLMGPSWILGFPRDKWFIIASFFLLGFNQVLLYIPIIPEMIERLQVDFDIVEERDPVLFSSLNDKVNDVYAFIYALSEFISPLIGTMLYKQLGQRITCDYLAFFNLTYALILFIFNCGTNVFAENRHFTQKLK